MTVIEMQARKMISGQTLEELLNEWELFRVNDKYIPTVRVWLLDEFEKRNPIAFTSWLNSSGDDKKLREYMVA